ncbi:MAG: YifB family Mg chelatase-like AAA ATPase [Kordiimonadaceae bacterium]|nr:YifB family Mg chelatase-like AAA ATPase [Kordiimonadaceae bacterium]
MVASVQTVAFEGIRACAVEVQVQISSGLPNFTIVGLPDKAVNEAKERVRSALSAIGMSLPAERITVNLSPADRPKEGSHYDLPIILALLAAMGVVPTDVVAEAVAVGELGLDASIRSVAGVLPAALYASGEGAAFFCPAASGAEAAWAAGCGIVAAPHVLALINHIRGKQILSVPEAEMMEETGTQLDLLDVKGQEAAKRALEIAAAGGHSLLMMGPPGSGKSMLAARLPSILPPLTPEEALETSVIASIAGQLAEGVIRRERPYRAPHHTASQVALIGGGAKAHPGEVSLAHAGVLFLDELPEFSRATLEALRQPIESGEAVIARAQAHVTYPARFQLITAMNPCRCGYMDDNEQACSRAPRCGLEYQSKISGPLYDRMDLFVDVPAVSAGDLSLPPPQEGSAEVAGRVAAARNIQYARFKGRAESGQAPTNAYADGQYLEEIAQLDDIGRHLLKQATVQFKLSARGYHRVLRVGRTIADLAGEETVLSHHLAEALSYRRVNRKMLLGRAKAAL